MQKSKIIIVAGIFVGIISFAVMIGYIGQGNVRQVPIFWKERIEQTVAFEDIDGKVQLKGISGIDGDPNPRMVTRTNFAYILHVQNNGDRTHTLYIEGLEIETDPIEPGKEFTLTIHPTGEGTYRYYDKSPNLEPLGYLEVHTVVPSDEFTGFLHDLI